jgi:hypothetical protein
MIKKTRYILVFGLLWNVLAAQVNNSIARFLIQDTNHHQVSLYHQSYVNSNTLNNKLLYGGYKQGVINRAQMVSAFDNAPTSFLMGLDLCQGLSYTHQRKNTQIFGSINQRMHAHTSLDPSIAELVFLGNKHHQGDTLKSNQYSVVSYLNYQQVQLGFLHSFSESGIQIGASVSGIQASNTYNLEVGSFRLYTDSFGQYINADLKVLETRSNPQKSHFFASNGFGFSTDFYVDMPVPLLLKKDSSLARVRVEINDFGVLWWNKQAQRQYVDSTLTEYRGVNLNNYIADSTYSEEFVLFQQTVRGKWHQFLPVYVSVSIQKKIQKHQFSIGITHRPNADFIPYLYLNDAWNITPRFSLLYGINHGGYGKFGARIGVAYRTHGFCVSVINQQIEGQLISSYSMGNSLFLHLSKSF